MCLMVYLASDHPAPLVPWDPNSPAFNVSALSAREEKVRTHFTKPHVYYIGSHEHCGCPFNSSGENDIEPYPPLDSDTLQSRASFVTLVANLLQHTPDIQLYACWDGDQSAQPEKRRQFPISSFRGKLSEREFLLITPNSSPTPTPLHQVL